MPRRGKEPDSPPNGYRTMSAGDPDAWPLLVAFDLDYTLWDLWIDTHISPPLKRPAHALNLLEDRRGQDLCFYREVPSILAELKRRKVHIAACSRTSASELAREALRMLVLPGDEDEDEGTIEAIDYFNTMEIYPGTSTLKVTTEIHIRVVSNRSDQLMEVSLSGSKLRHFKEVHRKTGIPFDQMLFFDDEHRNFEVESLGVTMQLVPSNGTNRALFEKGLALWRKRRGIKVDPRV